MNINELNRKELVPLREARDEINIPVRQINCFYHSDTELMRREFKMICFVVFTLNFR